ncbi:MAG TPA: sigma-70 family RNA polymerase sigma factor [Phycisphaerae bacterium]|nr:sigma-70 family RNA polymerase sigma factor [Phycisphaerae bacterium]
MSRPGSDALRRGLAAGSEPAFAELYDRFAGRLFRAALSMLGRREDAQDAVQEVFVAMVRSRQKLAAAEDIAAYLFASLRHAAGRLAARRARQPAAAQEAVADAPDRAAPAGADTDRLDRALAALPPEQREVVALKIDGGLTFAQIGQAVGVSPNTAASRYRYAIGKLRDALKETGS